MRMPFGKHEGIEVANLPDQYLMWLHTKCEGPEPLREPLRSAVRSEYAFRFAPARPGQLSAMGRRAVDEITKAGYRVLSQEHHPDHGGRTEGMQAINEAMSWIRRQVRTGA